MLDGYLSGKYRADHDPVEHAASLSSYYCPSIYQYLSNLEFCQITDVGGKLSTAETGLYIGIPLLLFVVISIVINWKKMQSTLLGFYALLLAGIFLFLSLSPAISALSFTQDIPFFPSVPVRFGCFAILYFFIGASIFSSPLYTHRLGLMVSVVWISVAILEFFPQGLPRQELLSNQVALKKIAQDDGINALHDFTRDHHKRLLHQIAHQKKITSAFIARSPKEPLRDYSKNSFLRFIRKGEEVQSKELQLSWQKLGIEAVLFQSSQVDAIDRINQIDGIVVSHVDDELLTYTIDNE